MSGERRFLFSPMLLAIAIIGGSVLGSNPCTTDPQDPCTHKCAYQGLAYVMDFSVFRQGHEQSYLHATDAAAHDYYFDACDVVPKSAAVCDGTTAQRPVAIQTWGAPHPPEFPADSCAGLGDASTRVCFMITNYPRVQVACNYTQGDSGRRVTLRYTCDGRTSFYAEQTDPGAPTYVIDLVGRGACNMTTAADDDVEQ